MKIIRLFLLLNIFLFERNVFPVGAVKLHILFQERAPYFMFNDTNKKLDDGILYHLTIKILKNANISFDFRESIFSKSLSTIKENKEKVCVSTALEVTSRNEYAQYSLPYFKENRDVVVFRKNDQRFSKYKNIKDILKDKNLILVVKKPYSYGVYVDKLLLDIKKYDKNSNTEDESLLKITRIENIDILKIIDKSKADYMMLSLTEYNYLKNSDPAMVKNLTFKTLADNPIGRRRFFLCSKLVEKETMDKLNQSILKVSGNL